MAKKRSEPSTWRYFESWGTVITGLGLLAGAYGWVINQVPGNPQHDFLPNTLPWVAAVMVLVGVGLSIGSRTRSYHSDDEG